MFDIDKEILYWIEQLGFEWINCGQLIDYIKKNYVCKQRDVVEHFISAMEYRVDIYFLDWDRVCDNDDDYVALSKYGDLYLNIEALSNDELELKRLNLIK